MTKREAELAALAKFAATGKIKKLEPATGLAETEVTELAPLTYKLSERTVRSALPPPNFVCRRP